jgi:membrane fusion protein (multidrug efflux system)
VEQAKAAIAAARINLDYTLIKAPVNGYIGRIPKRVGNLVGKNDQQGITTLSDIDQIYAYFSLSEPDFLYFNAHNPGNSLEEKIRRLRPVSLVLADGTLYAHQGKVDIANGQFDKTTGAIIMRATFSNPEKLLRSGNTGKVRMEDFYPSVILVPVSATIDQHDKIFVYALVDSNKVKWVAITVNGKSGTNYMVKDGLHQGQKVVLAGLETLEEGSVIVPQDSNAVTGR